MVERHGQPDVTFSQGSIEKLQLYDWPGNIRELSNVVMRTLTLADHEQEITADDIVLPTQVISSKKQSAMDPHLPENHLEEWRKKLIADFNENDELTLENILLEIKKLESTIGKELVLQALQKTYGNRNEAAKRLQISMRKLRYILNEKNPS